MYQLEKTSQFLELTHFSCCHWLSSCCSGQITTKAKGLKSCKDQSTPLNAGTSFYVVTHCEECGVTLNDD